VSRRMKACPSPCASITSIRIHVHLFRLGER